MLGILNPNLMGPAQTMQPNPAASFPPPPAQTPGAAGILSRLNGGLERIFGDGATMMQVGASMMGANSNWDGFAQGLGALGQVRAQKGKTNKTLEYLRKNDPEVAQLVEATGLDIKDAYAIHQQRAKAQKPNQPTYGLNPIYGRDAQGNTVMGTLGNDGSFKKIETPDFELSTGVDRVDLGTHFGLLDKRSGQMVGTLPKENYQEAFETNQGAAEGKIAGEARATAPQDLQRASKTVNQIDELLFHPGLPEILGPLDQFRGPVTLGAQGNDALARYNQLKGAAFLEAFQMLKGGGTITEIEGLKAEQAMARMERAQGEAEFKTALKDFRDAVASGAEKLRQQTGIQPGMSPQPQATSTGGYRILGVE